MAATTPVATPPTSPSSPPRRHIRNPSSISPPRPPPISTIGINNVPVLEEGRGRRKVVTRGEESPRFSFSKLLQFNNQQQQLRPEWDEVRPPLSPRHQQQPQQQPQQQQQQNHRHHRPHHDGSKSRNLYSRFRRGNFLGFLQSHYHVFHRQSEQRDPAERHSRGSVAASPQSPASSIYSSSNSSNPGSNGPLVTYHPAYNATISDFRAYATIASTPYSSVPTKATDIVYRHQDTTSSSILTPIATLANSAQLDSISVTPNSCNRGRISQPASPPNSKRNSIRSSLRCLDLFSRNSSSCPSTPPPTSVPNGPLSNRNASSFIRSNSREASQHQEAAKEFAPSSPSKHISKILEAGVKKIGLVKKRRSPPSHYLSLPVGGTASNAANGMYMLHSEDLSVAEFAKLAGITILPEEDEDSTSTSEESRNHSSVTSQGMTRPGTGSTADTLDSDRHLTCGSMGSSKFLKKASIWDPQFWTSPSQDGASQSVASSPPPSPLPISPVSISAPASPPLIPLMAGLDASNISRQPIGPLDSGSSVMLNSTASGSGGHENTISSLVTNREGFSSPAVPPRRVGQTPHPSKESIELSRSLSREMSYTSLTAVAIELRGDQDTKKSTEGAKSEYHSVQQGSQQQQQQQQQQSRDVEVEVAPPAIRLEPSEPAEQAGRNLQSQRLAHSVALHALQPARSKSNACRRPYFHSGSSKASRARSPSPSPLSRQLEMSDSEGFDSPMEEKDGFDFKEAPAGSTPVGSAPQKASTHTPVPRNSRFEISHRVEDTDTESDSLGSASEGYDASLYHHQSQSLPLILSDHPQDVEPQSPSSKQPVNLRPPNSDPVRKFTPGTKVGRFTLVQETSTKHADILRAQQEQDQHKRWMYQRRVSMGDMYPSRFYSDDESDHNVESEDLTGTKTHRRYSTASGVSGAAIERINPALSPEENVVIFQRKRVRRLQQQQQ